MWKKMQEWVKVHALMCIINKEYMCSQKWKSPSFGAGAFKKLRFF